MLKRLWFVLSFAWAAIMIGVQAAHGYEDWPGQDNYIFVWAVAPYFIGLGLGRVAKYVVTGH